MAIALAMRSRRLRYIEPDAWATSGYICENIAIRATYTCNYGTYSFVMNRNVNIRLFSNSTSHIQ
jgi:hypothetical protein